MARTIIIDAFGGDNAPLSVLQGARMAIDEYGVQVILTGNEDSMRAVADANKISLDGMRLVHTERTIPVEAEPVSLLKEYEGCSMSRAFQLLAEGEGDAFVSAGSTGALVVGGTFLIKRLPGIKRVALATQIPCVGGSFLLLDSGANHDCRPEMLQQFGIMGAAYMEQVAGVKEPRVGLVNIGSEETKGTDLYVQAHQLLAASPISFVGNVEAREVPLGACDVVVADGFTGNVMLKLTEGVAKFFSGELKEIFQSSAMGKLGYLAVRGKVAQFKKKMDATEYGGAPLLGTRKPVIKAHGNSNGKAMKNAIRQAVLMCDNDVIAKTQAALEEYKHRTKEAPQH